MVTCLLLMGLLVLVAVLGPHLAVTRAEAWKRELAALASDLGLRVTRDHPWLGAGVQELAGELSGHPLTLDFTSDGESMTHSVRTRVTGVETQGFRCLLQRRGVVTFLSNLLRARPLHTGDPAFDQAYTVHTSDPDLARRLLDRETRDQFLAAELDRVALEGGKLTLVHQRGPRGWSATNMVERCRRSLQAAETLLRRLRLPLQ